MKYLVFNSVAVKLVSWQCIASFITPASFLWGRLVLHPADIEQEGLGGIANTAKHRKKITKSHPTTNQALFSRGTMLIIWITWEIIRLPLV